MTIRCRETILPLFVFGLKFLHLGEESLESLLDLSSVRIARLQRFSQSILVFKLLIELFDLLVDLLDFLLLGCLSCFVRYRF